MRLSTMLSVFVYVVATSAVIAQTQAPAWPREAENPTAPKPPIVSARVAPLIGEYESQSLPGTPAKHLIMFEQDGKPWIVIDRGEARPFWKPSTDELFVEDNASPTPLSVIDVTIGGEKFTRVQVGPEPGGQLHVAPIRNVADVLRESLGVAPPRETGEFRPSDLVELAKIDPSIKRDIRYATTNNFLGSVFYAEARAFLQRPAAEALLRVQQVLRPLGYGLLIHDGYRPWYVTRTFWETTPQDKKWLVANPASGSKHNRGAAVDLTLVDIKTGAVIEMPSTYDESTPRAYAFYPGGTSLQRWHRALLRRTMEAVGFTVNPEEWWHFDYEDWKSYTIGNVTFDKIKK